MGGWVEKGEERRGEETESLSITHQSIHQSNRPFDSSFQDTVRLFFREGRNDDLLLLSQIDDVDGEELPLIICRRRHLFLGFLGFLSKRDTFEFASRTEEELLL